MDLTASWPRRPRCMSRTPSYALTCAYLCARRLQQQADACASCSCSLMYCRLFCAWTQAFAGAAPLRRHLFAHESRRRTSLLYLCAGHWQQQANAFFSFRWFCTKSRLRYIAECRLPIPRNQEGTKRQSIGWILLDAVRTYLEPNLWAPCHVVFAGSLRKIGSTSIVCANAQIAPRAHTHSCSVDSCFQLFASAC